MSSLDKPTKNEEDSREAELGGLEVNWRPSFVRFLKLPPSEQSLCLEAAFYLVCALLWLRLLPFRAIVERLSRQLPFEEKKEARNSASAILRALSRASRIVPRGTCLSRAIAGAMLFRRSRHPVELCVGIDKGNGDLTGHAWLEHRGFAILDSGAGYAKILMIPVRS
jgi:hypothetical protein